MPINGLFYLFSLVLIASAMMVVNARNPVHAVLFLVLCFFNAAGLFILLNAEFLAFILIIVYVGAVAVLFLFVVMMLNLRAREKTGGNKKYVFAGLSVGAVLLVELVAMAAWSHDLMAASADASPNIENTRALGRVLYTDYMLPFQAVGLILFVAMIGAIVLALQDRRAAKRQRAADQIARRPEDVLEVRKIKPGEGAS